MNDIETIYEMPEINKDNIVKAYSGKANKCMCGCSGKYFHLKKNQVKAGEERGYAVGDDEINDAQVTKIFNKIAKNASDGIEFLSGSSEDIFDVTIGNRIHAIYVLR